MSQRSRGGFTMVELLIIIGIIIVLVGLSVPLTTTWFQGDAHSRNTAIIRDTFRGAQSRAMASTGGQPWSIRLTSNSIALYPGSTYQSSTATVIMLKDSTLNNISIPDITFSTQHGVPSGTGTFMLTSSRLSTTFTLYGSGILSE